MIRLIQRSARAMAAAASLVLGAAALLVATDVHAETIKIGIIGPLTGPAAPWGAAAAGGPKVLATETNAKGGLDVGGKKYQVEVVAYDDQYKAANAVAAYNRLVNQDGVKFVMLVSSPSTLAIKQSVEDDKVIAMTSSLTEKAFDDRTQYMFRLYSPPPHFLTSLVSWMKGNMTQRRIVLVNPNDETGWAQTEFAKTAYKGGGFEVVGSETYERANQDFHPMLTKVVSMKPEIIDLATSPPATAGLIIRQAREMGFTGVFVQSGAGSTKELVAGAGKEAVEGTVNVLYADPSNAGYQRIITEYRKVNGQDPNNIIVSFYDAANVLLRAMQKAGTISDTTKIAAAFAQALPLKSVQGEDLTLGGKSSMGTNRQIMTVNYVSVLKNGEPVIVGKVN